MPLVTREEFEAAYAARSGITVTGLHDLGREAVPCGCGSDMCQGWAIETRYED